MFKTILVPTDGSEGSKKALFYAIHFAKIFGSVFKGLFVLDIKGLEGPFLQDVAASVGAVPFSDYQGKIHTIMEERGKSILKEFKKICDKNDVKSEIFFETGIVNKKICEAAHLADIIILGRQGEHAFIEDFVLGSTAQSVMRGTHKPVIVVTNNCSDVINNILVAYDGSDQAKEALAVAVNIAAERKNKLSLLIVEDDEAEQKNIFKQAKKYIEVYNVPFTEIMRTGDVSKAIIEEAKLQKSDLIVMGSYSHSRLYNLFLGSITQHVLHESNCPVLVIK